MIFFSSCASGDALVLVISRHAIVCGATIVGITRCRMGNGTAFVLHTLA